LKQISELIIAVFVNLLLQAIAFSQTTSPADITIDRDGILLAGKFYTAEGSGNFPTAILMHGFPGGPNDVMGIGEKLSKAGINVLFFNFSGTHKSQGKVSFNNSQLDIGAAYKFLHLSENIIKFKIDTSFICIGGWCYGGGMAMTYAANHPEISTVFTFGGNDQGKFFEEYIRNPEMKKMIDGGFSDIASNPEIARFEEGKMPWEIVETGIDKLDPAIFIYKSAALLAKKNILLICGWDDELTTIDNYTLPLYRALKKEKAQNVKIVAFQDDHYFKETKEEVAQTIIDWLKTLK
jgi:uncharacterized protein